jgi:MFS family permease
MNQFFSFALGNWQFCLLHFLEFAIWGAWFVVLGNLLNARGFTRTQIGRIYSTIPIGTMLATLIVGAIADKYLNMEWVIGASHLVGAVLLFLMAKTFHPTQFFVFALLYGIAFAPTLGLVNAIYFSNESIIVNKPVDGGFPWVRVFGTIGWIVAGLSHSLLIKKGEPVNERPLLLASALSLVLGLYSFTLPATPPKPKLDANVASEIVNTATPEVAKTSEFLQPIVQVTDGIQGLLSDYPVFFVVTLVAAMAMGLYFAFCALFLEKTGVPARTVGPLMTIGQGIEIFFMLSLPWFISVFTMNWVLMIGIAAWALRFGMFAIGRPIGIVLMGVAIHGICYDFFFAAGIEHANNIASSDLRATAQSVYAFIVYGLGMYLGSESAGWLNQRLTKSKGEGDGETNWRLFWGIPCVLVGVCAALFLFSLLSGDPAPVDNILQSK